jgi:hypothetical protein
MEFCRSRCISMGANFCDTENRVVILTGTGKVFCANPPAAGSGTLPPSSWDPVYSDGKYLLMNHLSAEDP